jgi:phosphate starvation-inducible PhoH-like protein
MLDEQTIEISPLAYMRGRTFKNSWIVADEMQNATPAQVKMLMSRIGQGSRIAITGDVEQADRPTADNGLRDLCQRLKHNPVNRIDVIELGARDTQRHPLITSILQLYH